MIRKISILQFSSILVFILHSCDMDKMPEGSLGGMEPFTMKDCKRYHIGMYNTFRTLTTGGFITYSDIQMDDFHAILDYGGSMASFYNGEITPGLELVEEVWGGHYITVGEVNYFLLKIDDLLDTGILSTGERYELQRYAGEAYFARAFSYFALAQKFCAPYNFENIGKEHGGLPLVTKYNPTDKNSEYPSRSTLEATFKLIVDDLDRALENLSAFEEKDGGMSCRLG